MNVFKKIYCRIYQTIFRIALPFLPYREPKILNDIIDISILLKEKQIMSALLVTDSGIRRMGLTQELEETVKNTGIKLTVYDQTKPNPTVDNVEEARELYLENNCECIIAFGGGSSMDCAKSVGARIAYPNKPLSKLKGLLKVLKKIPMLIAIPTTAGTGSEVTLTSVITDTKNKHKYTMNSFTLIPKYAVLDPKVTYTLPPSLTATTGMDALTHAVEAYIGRSTTKQTRKMSLNATKLIFENLEMAYNNPTNKEARTNMLNASYMAGIAFSKSYVGYIHAVAHSLGGEYNIPHGFANSAIMPIVLKMYGKSCYKKLYKLGLYSGICSKDDALKVGAEKFINAVKNLNDKMQIPEKIKGIKKEDIPHMAKHAESEANPLYPVPKLMSANELEKIYIKVADWSE